MKRDSDAPPAQDASAARAAAELWDTFRRAGDRDARRGLFDLYLPLARRIAATLFRQRVDGAVEFDDFFHFGTVGLLEALDRFDGDKGASFETFATYRIRGAILNGIPKASQRSELGSYQARVAKERVRSLQSGVSGEEKPDAFREMVDLTLELALGFFLQDDAAQRTEAASADSDPYACEAVLELRKDVAHLVEELPERERLILRYHYFQQLKFQQIADLMGLSKGRVSQLHRRALKSLRARCGPGRGLDSYL